MWSVSSFTQQDHIGLWKGIDQGQVGYISLDSTGFAFFIFENDTLGGESFIMEGQEACMKYEISYNHKPHTIDFILVLKENNMKVRVLPGIFEFETKDQMVMSLDFINEKRPRSFDDGDMIKLNRVTQKVEKEQEKGG